MEQLQRKKDSKLSLLQKPEALKDYQPLPATDSWRESFGQCQYRDAASKFPGLLKLRFREFCSAECPCYLRPRCFLDQNGRSARKVGTDLGDWLPGKVVCFEELWRRLFGQLVRHDGAVSSVWIL